jgi:hypothetical protein
MLTVTTLWDNIRPNTHLDSHTNDAIIDENIELMELLISQMCGKPNIQHESGIRVLSSMFFLNLI